VVVVGDIQRETEDAEKKKEKQNLNISDLDSERDTGILGAGNICHSPLT